MLLSRWKYFISVTAISKQGFLPQKCHESQENAQLFSSVSTNHEKFVSLIVRMRSNRGSSLMHNDLDHFQKNRNFIPTLDSTK